MRFEIKIDDSAVRTAFNRLLGAGADLAPLMRQVAATLDDITEQAFADQSDPTTATPWQELKPRTIKARTKRDYWPGKILQQRGQLAASITSEYGKDYAAVGTNTIYARIHQLGGHAGRGKKTPIPARPYLGVPDHGRDEILDLLRAHIAKATANTK